jgi:DNA-binding transcriptional ArsR family regulator
MPSKNRQERNVEFRSVGVEVELLPYIVHLISGEPFTRLTARQIAIFFRCYMQPEPQSVRALSRYLKVSRPSVSLALRRLERLGLLRRTTDLGSLQSQPRQDGRCCAAIAHRFRIGDRNECHTHGRCRSGATGRPSTRPPSTLTAPPPPDRRRSPRGPPPAVSPPSPHRPGRGRGDGTSPPARRLPAAVPDRPAPR